MKARHGLGEMLNRVAIGRDQFIIERDGRPMAAVIPVDQLDRLRSAARALLSRSLSRGGNRGAARAGREADLANEAKHLSRRRRCAG